MQSIKLSAAPYFQREMTFSLRDIESGDFSSRFLTRDLPAYLECSDIGDVFYWTGPNGSRCGIVNVNAGTSGTRTDPPLYCCKL
jgi:hypothetical protein